MHKLLIREIHDKLSELEALLARKNIQIDNLKAQLNGEELINYDRYGFRFTKKVIYYISQGIEEKRAIALAWDDFPKLRMSTAEMIWKSSRPIKSGLKLYARAYCVQKMIDAGYTHSEIAITLGISQTSVKNIISKGCVIE